MNRKIPRGKGYDKAATLGHLKKMVKGGVFVTDYVKQAGLKLDTFMLALTLHSFERGAWPYELIQKDPKLIQAECQQCGDPYWPSRRGTRFCSSYCGSLFRTDREYFGGKRNSTVGLEESVCQLCGRHVEKGLSSHHIYGKANDSDNEYLLALCKGCHALVSDLALKTWVSRSDCLEKLIWLAYTQRNGAQLLKARKEEKLGVNVTVSFSPAQYVGS